MKIVKVLTIFILLIATTIGSYAIDIIKPEIQQVAFWSGKWHINYNEVKNGNNLKSEELFVDGVLDRTVNVSTSVVRGFPMVGSYVQTECHKAYIVIKDNSNITVAQSDVFNFGDTSKCNMGSDVTNPIISIKGKNPQSVVVGESYLELGATAFDNRDGDLSASINIDATAVDTTTVGDYIVTYSVIDAAGNDALTTRTVNVVTASAVASSEIIAINKYSGNWHVAYKDLPVSPNLGVEKLFVDGTLDRQVNAGTTSSTLRRGFRLLGAYDATTCHVAYIVIFDKNSQEVTRTSDFNFGDTTKCGDMVKPVITLTGANPQTLTVGDTYSELGATASDNVDGDISSSIIIDATAVDTSAEGNYTVLYNVSDAANNDAVTISRTVTVKAVVLPVTEILAVKYYGGNWNIAYVDLPSSPNLGVEKVFIDGTFDRQVNAGTTSATGRRGFRLLGVYDNAACHEAHLVVYSTTGAEITRSATVNFGDISKCGDDTIKPIITLVGENPQEITIGNPYLELGALAFDNRDGNISVKISIDTSAVDTNTIGQYTVTYNVVDEAGNIGTTVNRIINVVKVIDLERPVISLLGVNPQNLHVGQIYTEDGATALDNLDGDISGNILIDATHLNTAIAGQYFVNYYIEDNAGNSKLIKRSVIVREPGITTGNYYISVDGNDSNDGKSLANAFKTIAHALETARGGDTILMKGGIYREGTISIANENNGTQYITLQNYNDELVEIKGSKLVSNWEHYQDNIWKMSSNGNSDLNKTVHYQQVFYGDGKSLQKIGYPNYIEIASRNIWSMDKRFIPIKENPNNPFGMSEGTFYVEKLPNDTFDLYVWLPNGQTPNDADVTMEVSDERYILNAKKLKHFKLKGLSFMHTASAATASYANAFQSGYGVQVGFGAIVEDCEIAHTDFSGMILSLSSEPRATDMKQRVTRSKFHHNGAVGITAVSGGYLLEDSEFYENAERPYIQYWHTGSIKTAAQGWGEIKNNYFHDERANGIWFDYCYSGQPILVHNNYLDKIGILAPNPLTKINPRGHALFFEQSNNIKAYNNIVNEAQQRGIYISNSENLTITNNLIRKSILQQIGLSDDDRTHLELKNIKIINNILMENQTARNNSYDILFFHSSGRQGITFDPSNELRNNIIYNSNGTYLLYMEDGNWSFDDNIKTNPLLNTNGSDFLNQWHLGVGSPALNQSTLYNFLNNDYYHNPRNDGTADIGPFEK